MNLEFMHNIIFVLGQPYSDSLGTPQSRRLKFVWDDSCPCAKLSHSLEMLSTLPYGTKLCACKSPKYHLSRHTRNSHTFPKHENDHRTHPGSCTCNEPWTNITWRTNHRHGIVDRTNGEINFGSPFVPGAQYGAHELGHPEVVIGSYRVNRKPKPDFTALGPQSADLI